MRWRRTSCAIAAEPLRHPGAVGAARRRGAGERGLPRRPAVPTAPIDGVDYVELQQAAASKFFASLKAGRSLGKLGQGFQYTPFSPAQITVQVFDLSSGGKAAQVAAYLKRAGFGVIGVAPPRRDDDDRDPVRRRGRSCHTVVASYLPQFRVAFTQAGTSGADVYVVVGPGAKGVPPRRLRPVPLDIDVEHIARLARLQLSAEELDRLRLQLPAILEAAARVGEVAAEDVPPTSHPSPVERPPAGRGEGDVDAGRGALDGPEVEEGRFRVPMIVGSEDG